MRLAINAAVIQDKKLLIVRKNKTWILPGGQPESGESDLECLCREIDEELSGTKFKDFRFYRTFEGKTPHRGDTIKVQVYFAEIDGQLLPASNEILEASWVDDFSNYNLSVTTSKMVDSLMEDKYL